LEASSTTVDQQITAMHQQAGMCLLPTAANLILRGADRANLLHNLCSNDLKGLAAGSGAEAFICNPQGKILAHILVYANEDSLRVISLGTPTADTVDTDAIITDAVDTDAVATGAGTEPDQPPAFDLAAYIDRYIFREDVQVEDAGAAAVICVAGATADAVLKVAGVAPPAQRYGIRPAVLAGCSVSVVEAPFVAPACYCIILPDAAFAAPQQALQTAGAVVCGVEAFEAARIATGFPVYGRDIRDNNLPQEVCRNTQAISFTTGCYIGQETVARIDALGHVNWNLAGLQITAGSLPADGGKLTADGKEAGRITSTAMHPLTGGIVAMGYVRRLLNKPGAVLKTSSGNATITPLPMV